MKRVFSSAHGLRSWKRAGLAGLAAALMASPSQAGTTLGINFWGNYFAGFDGGSGVTDTAFGVAAANWYTTPNTTDDAGAAATSNFATGPNNALNLSWSAPYTGVSWINRANAPGLPPGDAQAWYGYLDGGDATYADPGYLVSVSGLASLFPSGYIVQAMASADTGSSFSTNTVSDGLVTQHLSNPVAGTTTIGGVYALGQASGLFTGDALSIASAAAMPPQRGTLNGFLVTDQPVVSFPPAGGGMAAPGTPLLLTAPAVGIPPLAYQWWLNGAPLPSGTNAAYSVPAASAGDAGAYLLVVTNAYGAATSDVVAVQVPGLPVLLGDVASVTNYLTMSARLSVSVSGSGPLSYQWSKDGGPLTAETNAGLSLENLQTSAAGAYQVVVSNNLGAVTSSLAYVSVLTNLPPQDPFDGASAPLAGQGSNAAWGGPWTQTATGYNGENSIVHPGGSYQDGTNTLLTAGGAVLLATAGTTPYENIRPLLATLGGPAGGTVYLSFLGRLTNTAWAGVELVQDGTGAILLGETFLTGEWGWGDRQNINPRNGHSGIDCRVPAFVVYRFDFTPTNTLVRLYVNPALAAEPATPSAEGVWTNFQFDAVRLTAHGQYGSGAGPSGWIDEIRFGGGWASVTPAPLWISSGPTGSILNWNYGVLQASPGLGAAAAWTNVPNAAAPFPVPTSDPARFYRVVLP